MTKIIEHRQRVDGKTRVDFYMTCGDIQVLIRDGHATEDPVKVLTDELKIVRQSIRNIFHAMQNGRNDRAWSAVLDAMCEIGEPQ